MQWRAITVLVAACVGGCGGGDDIADDTGDDTGPVVPNTRESVQQLATAIYDAVDAGADVELYVEAVMAAFNVPALTEPAELEARIAASLPAFTKPQTLDLAAAFAASNHVELDNFLAALNDYGLHRTGGAPIDRAFLDERFAVIAAKTTYEVDEALPALVLALSAERTARYAASETVDPLWGDGLLDPLQTTLILYAIGAEVSGVSAPPPMQRRDNIGGIFDFVIERIVGRAESRVVDEIEWPIGFDDLAQSAPCVSLALYGHKLTAVNTPDTIYHQQVDVASPPPYVTMVDSRLVFLDDYWDNYAQTQGFIYTTLVGLAGCKLPRQGTVPGKPLTWSVGAPLQPHGSFNFAQGLTGDDGQAFASWSTVAETTPMMYRTTPNLEVAFDWVKVRAGNLVPGWNTLALVAGALKRTPDTAEDYLAVRYYKNPCTGAVAPGLVPGPGQCIDEWHGSAEDTFTASDGSGGYKITGTDLVWKPVVTGGGETIYEITGGSISYEMWDNECTYAFSPATVTWDPAGTVASSIDYNYDPPPITYSGDGSMFWMTQMTATCGSESGTVPQLIGGQFFRADVTTQTGDVMADNYMLLDHHYVYSFHR